MSRDFVQPGETLVKVKFGAHYAGWAGFGASGSLLSELGLAEGSIDVMPTFYDKEIKTDDFGPDCPAEIMAMMASVDIHMTLVHFDPTVLNVCALEAQGIGPLKVGAAQIIPGSRIIAPWYMVGQAGYTLGHGLPLQASGNHWLSMTLLYNYTNDRSDHGLVRFPAVKLASPSPYKWPLGTGNTTVDVTFRGIPYVPILASGNNPVPAGPAGANFGEPLSSGVALWDTLIDT